MAQPFDDPIATLPIMFGHVGSWALLRRTIDDSFVDVDLVVLPTRRRIPRKIDAALKRERTDKPLNPEFENTGQFNAYGIAAISVPCGFSSADPPVLDAGE